MGSLDVCEFESE